MRIPTDAGLPESSDWTPDRLKLIRLDGHDVHPFETASADQLRSGTADWIDGGAAAELAAHPLDCIDTEYPHYVHAVEGPDDEFVPSDRHPAFYGCFDWHSAVHSHWALVRGLRLFEEHPEADTIRDRVGDHLTPERLEPEAEHLREHPDFENPYGLSWLLALAAELSLFEDDADAACWRDALEPLAQTAVENLRTGFFDRERPIRTGTHGNSAFALVLVLDYARTVGDDALEGSAIETARRWYGDDEAAPVEYEPIGWDFCSPTLTEADLMRRVLPGSAFREWLDAFVPDLTVEPYDDILDPVSVEADDGDGMALHLVGLNCSKAWCLAGIADAAEGWRHAAAIEESARRHAEAAVSAAFTDDYAGAHWLSSFVLYLLTRRESGISVPR